MTWERWLWWLACVVYIGVGQAARWASLHPLRGGKRRDWERTVTAVFNWLTILAMLALSVLGSLAILMWAGVYGG